MPCHSTRRRTAFQLPIVYELAKQFETHMMCWGILRRRALCLDAAGDLERYPEDRDAGAPGEILSRRQMQINISRLHHACDGHCRCAAPPSRWAKPPDRVRRGAAARAAPALGRSITPRTLCARSSARNRDADHLCRSKPHEPRDRRHDCKQCDAQRVLNLVHRAADRTRRPDHQRPHPQICELHHSGALIMAALTICGEI